MFLPQYRRGLTRSVNVPYRRPARAPICAGFRCETVAAARLFIRSNSTKPPKFEPSDFKPEPRNTGSTKNAENRESSKGKPLNGKRTLHGLKGSFQTEKVAQAWSTPTKWYPIPIALGALVLLAVQYRKQTRGEIEVETQGPEGAVIRKSGNRVDGPWQVCIAISDFMVVLMSFPGTSDGCSPTAVALTIVGLSQRPCSPRLVPSVRLQAICQDLWL